MILKESEKENLTEAEKGALLKKVCRGYLVRYLATLIKLGI